MNIRQARQSVIDTCLRMNALGINQGTSGNVSLRHKGAMLITPSGMPYDTLRPDDIVSIDMDGTSSGPRLPSSEWRMHLDILRGRTETHAVVHTHSTYATAYSCLRNELPAFHYMIAVAGGDTIRCADYATFGTAALSENMLRALENRTACLLANHGVIATGETLEKALALAVEVETLAKQYVIACQAGSPIILDRDEMERVIEKFKTYGKQPDAT